MKVDVRDVPAEAPAPEDHQELQQALARVSARLTQLEQRLQPGA